MSLAERILEQPLELIEGVEETLERLASRHDLTLFTKGHPEEQKLKVDRSGLGALFRSHGDCEGKGRRGVPADCRGTRAWRPSETWMIGNSPKSDINPALEAGLGAVLVPHARTWVLEHRGTARPGRRALFASRDIRRAKLHF